MLEPLNAKEHNQAFVKFLFFFVITLIMVVSAIFINFEIPSQELRILRERSDNYRNKLIAEENFKNILSEFMSIANRSDSSSKAMIESEASPKLEALRGVEIDNGTTGIKMNVAVYALANKYLAARSRLADLQDVDKEIARLKNKITELEGDLKACRDRVNFGDGGNPR
jgi:hypothetical protein